MIVTVQAVRAYGSSDYYGPSPRSVPDGNPIAISEYPRARHRTLIYFGTLPTAVVRANRVRLAIGRLMLDSLFGGHDAEMLPDDRIDRYLASDEESRVGTDHNWYVTFVVEKALDVEGAAIGAGRYMWLAPDTTNKQIEATLDYASDGMDRLAAVASTVIDPGMFEDLVIGDRVFFSLAGRETFGLPEATGAAMLSVGRQTMPLADLDGRLRKAASASSGRRAWLSSVQDLHLVALRERDPWKRFY